MAHRMMGGRFRRHTPSWKAAIIFNDAMTEGGNGAGEWASEWRRVWPSVLLFSLLVAVALWAIAPAEPARTDRATYEFMGRAPLSSECQDALLCTRVAIPVVVEHLPLTSEANWRAYGIVLRALTGFVMGAVTVRLTGRPEAGFIASLLTQTSFALGYTVYDPWTTDPAVFMLSALFALAWFWELPFLALGLGLVGALVKQSPAIVAGSLSLAALLRWRSERWVLWLGQGVVASLALIAFNVLVASMLHLNSSAATGLIASGGWLAIQLRNLGPATMGLYALAAFGFGSLFAILGFRHAPERLRALALGSIMPFLVLCAAQGDFGRSLGNAFFVVVPLEVIFLLRVPIWMRWAAVIANLLFTVRFGVSVGWLPSSGLLIAPAGVLAAWAIWVSLRADRTSVTRKSTNQAGTSA